MGIIWLEGFERIFLKTTKNARILKMYEWETEVVCLVGWRG